MESPLLIPNSKNQTNWTPIGQYYTDLESFSLVCTWLEQVYSCNSGQCYHCNNCSQQYLFKLSGSQMNIFKKKEKSQINCGDCKELICGKKFIECYKCKANNFISGICNCYTCQKCFSQLCLYCNNPPQLFQQEQMGCTTKASNFQRYSYLIGMMTLSIILFPIFLYLDFRKDIFEEKMFRFHQYILSKYKPIVLLFLYQIFLIVYLFKFLIILGEFVVEANRSRWRDLL